MAFKEVSVVQIREALWRVPVVPEAAEPYGAIVGKLPTDAPDTCSSRPRSIVFTVSSCDSI